MKIKELKNEYKIPKLEFSKPYDLSTYICTDRKFNDYSKLNLPHSCGVYVFFNSMMEVMYVGKSVNLKQRFSQHFNGGSKVYSAYYKNKENIKYYSYAICNVYDIELYEMLYTNIFNPKLISLSDNEIRLKNII